MHYCYGIIIQPIITPNFVTYSGIIPEFVKLQTRNYSFGPLLKVKASINNNNNNFTSSKSELTLYEVLGIPEFVSMVELKRAYKQEARKCHPDMSPSGQVKEYTKRFIMVREAYEMLSDPVTRAIYDRDLAKGIQFTFSTSRRYYHSAHRNQVSEEKKQWKSMWESQLWELKRRSDYKEGRGNMTWGARMRQRNYTQFLIK